MSIRITIRKLVNTHFNSAEERDAVQLSDRRLQQVRHGSLLAVHVSRNVSSVMAVDRSVGTGTQLSLALDAKRVPEDTQLVFRLYDWVLNYPANAKREHVWCLNAALQHTAALQSQIITFKEDHITLQADIVVEGVELTPAPYSLAEQKKAWSNYIRFQRDLYQMAHPALVSALDCMNVYDYVGVDSAAAGFTFVRAPAPANVDTQLLLRCHEYATFRYKALYGNKTPLRMDRFCNLLLPLISLAMPYKPDIIYQGTQRRDIDYFDDPFLSEAGDCEDLSLGTLRIVEMFTRDTDTVLPDPLSRVATFLRQFVWGLALVSIHVNNAHMVVMGLPKARTALHFAPSLRPMLIESTAPTLMHSDDTADSETVFHPYIKLYSKRNAVYNFVITLLVNDAEHVEYTFLTGNAHGLDIGTLLADEAYTIDKAFLVPHAKQTIDILTHEARNQTPYNLPPPCMTSSATVFSKGDLDESKPCRVGLCNIHSYLHMTAATKTMPNGAQKGGNARRDSLQMADEDGWDNLLEMTDTKAIRVVSQQVTESLETFVILLQ